MLYAFHLDCLHFFILVSYYVISITFYLPLSNNFITLLAFISMKIPWCRGLELTLIQNFGTGFRCKRLPDLVVPLTVHWNIWGTLKRNLTGVRRPPPTWEGFWFNWFGVWPGHQTFKKLPREIVMYSEVWEPLLQFPTLWKRKMRLRLINQIMSTLGIQNHY